MSITGSLSMSPEGIVPAFWQVDCEPHGGGTIELAADGTYSAIAIKNLEPGTDDVRLLRKIGIADVLQAFGWVIYAIEHEDFFAEGSISGDEMWPD